MSTKEYWRECIVNAASDCGLVLTAEQTEYLTESVEGCHENYGLAFYTPPSSDRVANIEREWKDKYESIERDFAAYRDHAEKAVKTALRQPDDAIVRIGARGEVLRYDGRTEQIQ